ncbi:GNAT family N-acetyltransferase [Glutamicibacter sp. BSL13]
MAFHNSGFEAPDELVTESFLLRPIRAADAQLDYEAVMERKDFLRDWEQTGWPEDGFMVEDNHQDLARLEERHSENRAYAYTVMTHDQKLCLGCVYVMPTDASMFSTAKITALGEKGWTDFEGAVYFWTRGPKDGSDLNRQLLECLRHWFTSDWGFAGLLVVTGELLTEQIQVLEASGLPPLFRIEERDKPHPYLAYVLLGYD